MIFLALIIIYILSIILSLYLFKKTFNPLSVYSTIWFSLLALYEIRLINYDVISLQTWVVIGGSYLAFIIGIIIPYLINGPVDLKKTVSSDEPMYKLFHDNMKLVKFIIVVFSLIGLFGAIQHWIVLLNMYGSIVEVFLHLSKIYKMRIRGELEGVIPYLSVFSYVAVFLVAVYSAYRKKFSLLTLVPFFSIIMKGIGSVGRQGILYGFLEFFTTYVIANYYFSKFFVAKKKTNKGILVTLGLFIVLLVFSVIFIRDFRGNDESFTGETRALQNLKGSVFITPSIYLYLSAHVGVLNKYYEKEIQETRVGENTFQFFYNTLSKFDITEPAQLYQKAYYVPVWTNTGTYLREIDADFGTSGTYLIPFLLGFLSFYYWKHFLQTGKPIYLILLVHLFLIIWFSFLMMITRGANWFISIGILYFVFNMIQFKSGALIQKYSNLSWQK